jgi:hypothetical protein
MTDQHPITPPPELIKQWQTEGRSYDVLGFAIKAAQWGADQELEACCEWTRLSSSDGTEESLRVTRRPKSPSLKEQALQSVKRFESGQDLMGDLDTIRRALEALPND